MSIYTATVRYGADPEPYPGKYGNSFNIVVTPHDPEAPEQNENGDIRIYKTEGTPECAYIRRLSPGDEVTLILQKKRKGDGYYYQVSVPPGGASSPPKVSPSPSPSPGPSQSTGEKHVVTVHELTEDEMEAYRIVTDNLAWQYEQSLSVMKSRLSGLELTDHELANLAMSLFKSSRGWWRTDMKVSGSEPSTDDRDAFQELWENMEGDDTSAWVNAASVWLDETGEIVISAVKALNISSGDYLPNKAWELVNIVDDYLSMLDSGANEDIAKSAVADRHGLKLPADPLF